MTDKEILELTNAVKTIKEYCNATHSCKKCHFSTPAGTCLIQKDNPGNWKIIEPRAVIKLME